MPEYLAPGVFVEEVSFRSKSIEGVATSTTGFAGLTRFGPVCFTGGPKNCEPRLVTSYVEFERIFGGIEPLYLGADDASAEERLGYLAHAVRAFFENGGKRLYVARVFTPRVPAPDTLDFGVAALDIGTVDGNSVRWRARWPGRAGNVHVTTEVTRSKNVAVVTGGVVQVPRARAGAVVEVLDPPPPNLPVGNAPLVEADLRVIEVDANGVQTFRASDGTLSPPGTTQIVQLIELRVIVQVDPQRIDEYGELATAPGHRAYIGTVLAEDDGADPDAAVYFDWQPGSDPFAPAALAIALQGGSGRLEDGHDGLLPSADDFAGEEADPDDPEKKATGLAALGEIEDIAIVALPDAGDLGSDEASILAGQKLVGHAERLRYRIAVVDPPRDSSLSDVRDFRGQFDSKYAAMYYPWIEIPDPDVQPGQGTVRRNILLPPSGFVTGIYARNDIERGVHKAPANEVVRGLARFEVNVNKARNEVLNPEGINALRFFEGRGHRVWGARTMSSDPEWKYVNVRRLFLFIERSIDEGTQWAVFEPNGPRLWANIRRTIEDFLLVLWRDGALLGQKPEQAFFVRCDRTTMTQNDLDNGRLICLIGVAPVRPAEFVIFRIGQWTADAKAA